MILLYLRAFAAWFRFGVLIFYASIPAALLAVAFLGVNVEFALGIALIAVGLGFWLIAWQAEGRLRQALHAEDFDPPPAWWASLGLEYLPPLRWQLVPGFESQCRVVRAATLPGFPARRVTVLVSRGFALQATESDLSALKSWLKTEVRRPELWLESGGWALVDGVLSLMPEGAVSLIREWSGAKRGRLSQPRFTDLVAALFCLPLVRGIAWICGLSAVNL